MKVKRLNKYSFEQHPVWRWDDENTSHIPVDQSDPLPDDVGDLFIKASFYAPDGLMLEGYIVGLVSFHAIGIFVDDKSLLFNSNFPQMAHQELGELYSFLRMKPFPVFPLRYETNFHFAGGDNISGFFDFKQSPLED
jgi:hypothetical protein